MMDEVLQAYRVAAHDYEEVVQACEASGGADLEDQRRGKERILREQEEALAGWIVSQGYVEGGA
jgi:hypothetical protein